MDFNAKIALFAKNLTKNSKLKELQLVNRNL
jgi:hypothetical protein